MSWEAPTTSDRPPADEPPAPGWWMASDGQWYPPQAHPAAPPAGYGYPSSPFTGYTAPPSNGMATAALVLGIIAICFFWALGLGLLLGVLAVVFGAIGLSTAKKSPGRPLAGRATAGIVTGLVAIVLGFGFLALVVWAGSEAADDLERLGGVNSDPPDGSCDEDRYLQDPDCP